MIFFSVVGVTSVAPDTCQSKFEFDDDDGDERFIKGGISILFRLVPEPFAFREKKDVNFDPPHFHVYVSHLPWVYYRH